ncbi:uncharacterized protein LOC144730345 isoform X1 [Lampetra planeri]
MDTRRTARAGVPQVEDTAEIVEPETAQQDIVQPGPDAFLPGHQDEEEPPSEGLRLAHARLAELLYAAAATLEHITRLGAGGPPRGEENRRPLRLPAISTDSNFESPAIAAAAAEDVAGLNLGSNIALAGAAASPPAEGASSRLRQAIPSAVHAEAQPSYGDSSLRASMATAALHQRLPPLKEFVGAEGDWGGFQRRFLAHQEMARWSDAEALCALPALLDSDALAALTSAPREKRSTLQMALQLLAGVYGPSAECRQQFYDRQRGAKESPLAYRTSLLALAKTAFPRMDDDGVDAMVTEKILLLADDLDIAVVAQEDTEMSSLQAARLLHANLLSQRQKASRAAAGRAVKVYAVDRRLQQGTGARSGRDGSSRFDRPSSPPALPRCFNCGVRGHVASGCHSPRQRGTTPRQDAGPPPPKLHQHNPASRGTPHVWPKHTLVTHSHTATNGGPTLRCDGPTRTTMGTQIEPRQWSMLAHRVVAASSGSSAVVGHIDGVEVRILVDTGASATIISELIYNILPVQSRPLLPVNVPFYAANGGSLGIIGQIRAQICIGDIKLSSPIFVSSSLAVPCLLGTDFLGKMPIRILIDQGCIELPSGRRMSFLPSPTAARTAFVTVPAFVVKTVRVPPGAQMLVPLKLRRPFAEGIGDQGILLGPSRAGVSGPHLIPAQTVVRGDGDPFIAILNVGSQTVVVPQGTVLAHATPVPCEEPVANHVGTAPRPHPHSDSDGGWLDALCAGSTDLSNSERQQLRTLLREFSDVFSRDKYDLGCTHLLCHHIDTGDSAPIRQNPFRLSPAEKDHVKSAIDDMLAADINSPSTSPWGAPIVLVKKQDGSLRFCVDFRRLNKISVADAYPLARMDESMDALAGGRFFSALDLLSGFWQLPLDDDSKPKTAFRTPHGLFQFNRLPMGLLSAPATFQRLMELVLAGLQWESCLIYLDDVIVFSKTFDEHLQRLRAVILKMRAANLKFKPQKCHLLRDSVRYLGHIVGRSGIATDPAKTQCVSSWPTPTSVGEVRSFIGFASYYRRFVADFATIAKPLHALTSKGVRFHWGQEEEAAFCSLRDALVKAPPLIYPDFSEPFLLDTDASNTGIGGVLSQVVDGVERVVAYGSRVLSPAEQRYCVTRRELLAIVYFIQQYRPYLYGRHFTVRTDHAALQYALRVQQPSGQLSRWLEILQDFDFETTYRKGVRHTNADALSRMPTTSECACLLGLGRCKPAGDMPVPVLAAAADDETLLPNSIAQQGKDSLLGLPVNEWGRLQMEDTSLLASRRRAGEAGRGTGDADAWEMHAGLLMHWDGKSHRHRLVVPSGLRGRVVWAAHERLLHLGTQKTLALLQLDFFWPGMTRDVADLLASCPRCAQRKPPARESSPPLQSIRVSRVNELVALDILGPFPATPRGNRYLLTGVEYFTRWPMAWPLANQSAAAIVEAFVQGYVMDKGAPERLLTDQGKFFFRQTPPTGL